MRQTRGGKILWQCWEDARASGIVTVDEVLGKWTEKERQRVCLAIDQLVREGKIWVDCGQRVCGEGVLNYHEEDDKEKNGHLRSTQCASRQAPPTTCSFLGLV